MRQSEHKINISYITIIVILLAIALVAVFLFFGMKGETKISGETTESEKVDSIVCKIRNFDYPYFSYNNSISENTKITATFNGDKLKSIYLIHEMVYNNNQDAAASESRNHADMNKSFGSVYGADAFNANYYTGDNTMRMTIYAETQKLDEDAKKYFLATGTSDDKNSLIENYKKQGFTCKDNTN